MCGVNTTASGALSLCHSTSRHWLGGSGGGRLQSPLLFTSRWTKANTGTPWWAAVVRRPQALGFQCLVPQSSDVTWEVLILSQQLGDAGPPAPDFLECTQGNMPQLLENTSRRLRTFPEPREMVQDDLTLRAQDPGTNKETEAGTSEWPLPGGYLCKPSPNTADL